MRSNRPRRRAGNMAVAIARLSLVSLVGAAHADDMLAARSLAATCAGCHGTEGRARGEIKPLAGRAAADTIAAFGEFRSGTRAATVMHQIAKGYSDEQVRLVAGFFAARKAP